MLNGVSMEIKRLVDPILKFLKAIKQNYFSFRPIRSDITFGTASKYVKMQIFVGGKIRQCL
jgi:hypothetical protein